jgi:quercetin dioxygenase-like cupin family protein
MSTANSIIRDEGEGERRWFYGGGLHVWKATAEDTNGSLILFEDQLARGKTTPLHHHPDQDEVVYVIDGEILYSSAGVERRVTRGATIVTPRGVPHAFLVLSESARLLLLQSPGSGQAFYRGASEPAGTSDGKVDFSKIRATAEATGTTVVLGPPPFQKP